MFFHCFARKQSSVKTKADIEILEIIKIPGKYHKTRQWGLTKIQIPVILPARCKMAICALVAQLAEHIHGKDKVISSILIEG